MGDSKGESAAILTIGHSNRTVEDLIALLQAHGVTLVADVRTVPRSRHNPQFNLDVLPGVLPMKYRHMPELGGLRHPRRDSINSAWQNDSFRGYADYMQTAEFSEGLDRLIEAAQRERVAIMCAESVPWRCHRSLIADALYARGIVARHIMTTKAAKPHTLTSFARVSGAQVTYPGLITAS